MRKIPNYIVLLLLHLLISPAIGSNLKLNHNNSFINCSGKVVTKDGVEIKNAKILLYKNFYDPDTFQVRRSILQQVNSNDDGIFTIQIPASTNKSDMYTVIATAPGYSLGWKNWNKAAADEIEITLGEHGTFSGFVVDGNQKPIQNADVRLLLVSRDNEDSPFSDVFDWMTTTSKQDGSFQFTHIPLDAKAELIVQAKGRSTYCTILDNPNDDPQFSANQNDISISLPKESTIVGKCINLENSEPVAGVKVALQFNNGLPFVPDLHQIATTSENGEFRFKSLCEGSYHLSLPSNPKETSEWVSIPAEIQLAAEEEKQQNLNITKGGILTVKVKDAQTLLPLNDTYISIVKFSESGYYGQAGQTDQSGVSHIRVFPDTYDFLQIQKQGYRTEELEQQKEIKLGDSQTIEIKLHKLPSINGTVYYKNKRTGNVQIVLSSTGDQTTTNEIGHFEIQYIDHPQELLSSYIIGLDRLQHLMGIQRVEDVNDICDLHLSKSISLSGTIIDPDNTPLKNASVSIYLITEDGSVCLENALADAMGKFIFPDVLPNNTYRLCITSEQYALKIHEFEIGQLSTNGFTVDPIQVGTVIIKGYAYDESKRPVEGAAVDIYNVYRNEKMFLARDVQLAGSGYTDSEGKYQIEIKQPPSTPNSQFAIIQKNGYALRAENYKSNFHQFEQVTLSKKQTGYSGFVIDTSGNPVEEAMVYAFVDDLGWMSGNLIYENSFTRWLHTKTDGAGYFEFKGIPLNAKGEFGVVAEGYVNSYTWPTEKSFDASISAGKNNIEIVMQKPSTLVGSLIDKNTLQPIPNERVYLFRLSSSRNAPFMNFNADTGELVIPYTLENDAQELVTDNDGKFTAQNLTPGDYGLSVFSYISPQRTWSSIKQIITIPEDSAVECTLEAIKTGRVKIQVTNRENGTAMENVSVKVLPKELEGVFIQNLTEFNTDSTGAIELSLSPGQYTLDSLTKKDYVCLDAEEKSFTVQSEQNSELYAQMAYSPGFWGICLDHSNTPVSGADIYLKDSTVPIATSDSDGLFSIPPEIIAKTEDILIITARQKEQKLGGILFQNVLWTDKLLKIEMKSIVTFSGKLTTDKGTAINDTNVELLLSDTINLPYSMKNCVLFSQSPDDLGVFSIDMIPSDYPYALQATKEGYEKFYLSLEDYRFNQENNDLGEIVLRGSSLAISGYLVDQLGFPIEGIEISIYEKEKYGKNACVTDSAGKFKIEDLAEGNIKLQANYKWELCEYGTFQAGTDHNRFVLENTNKNGRWIYPRNKQALEGAEVVVTLLDAESKEPITGKEAYLQISGNNISNPFINPDDSGKVTFSVDTGHYQLQGEKYPDYQRTSIEVDVESGQSYEFQLILNQKPKLTGKITDFQGNPIDTVECKIYPMEYYGVVFPEVQGDGTYEFVWDTSKYQSGRDPYLFVHNADSQCGRFYKIDVNQKKLDIVLEPAAYLLIEDKEKLRVNVTFYDNDWDNPYLNTYLDTLQKTKEGGFLKVSGLYPIPEQLKYHISVSENRKSKQAIIDADEIIASEEINVLLKEKK